MQKKKICILCGNSILKMSSTDPYVCSDCEKESAEGRYLNEWTV